MMPMRSGHRGIRGGALRGGGGDFGVVLGACVRGVYELPGDAAAAGARAFAVDDTGGESKARTAVMAAAEVRRRYGSSVGRTSSPSRCNALWCRIRPVCCPLELPARRPATSSVAPKRAGLCAVRCGIVGCGLCMEVCEVWSLRHTTCETCCETLLATI